MLQHVASGYRAGCNDPARVNLFARYPCQYELDYRTPVITGAADTRPLAACGFANRSYSRLKLLIWDANGVWLCQRSLYAGRFHWLIPL